MEYIRTRFDYLTFLTLGCLAVFPSPGSTAAEPMPSQSPVSLIFDTDICGDCDDVLALGMIHSLQSRGKCRLLAVTVSVDHPKAAPFVDAINTFYGRGAIPIGVVGKGGVVEQSKYAAMVDQKTVDGKFRYPHSLLEATDAPSASSVLRSTLDGQPDQSVVIVQVGFSTNLARLLDSPPDQYSPLSGRELIARKVRLLSLMAGAFEPIHGDTRYKEYNVVRDIPSAQALARNWPTPMAYSGFEIGIALEYPSVSIERDYGYVEHHPLAEAYIRYIPPPHNRPTWDLTSVLYAIQPDRGYFDLSPTGTVTIESDGSSRFTPGANGKHRYLMIRPDQRGRTLESLVQLSSQPPNRDHSAH